MAHADAASSGDKEGGMPSLEMGMDMEMPGMGGEMQPQLSEEGALPALQQQQLPFQTHPLQQQMLAQIQQVQQVQQMQQLDAAECVGRSSSFTIPLNDIAGGAGTTTPNPTHAHAHPQAPRVRGLSPAAQSLVRGLGPDALEPIPYSGIEARINFAMLSQEQERKIKMIEIQRLRLQKQQLELQIARQEEINRAASVAPRAAPPAPMPRPLPMSVEALWPVVGGGGGNLPTSGTLDASPLPLAQGAPPPPPSSLLAAKLSGSNGGSPPQIALAPADGTVGTTPQFNPFGGMQA
jgi:hypothetical protein